MKAQSFEHQLRHAVPPAPDRDARLRARRAALAEFAKVQGTQDAAESVADSALARAASSSGAAESGQAPAADAGRRGAEPRRKSESFWPLGWPLKSAWLGGMATACVVVVGVSVVWLMPSRDRDIKLHVPMATTEMAKSKAPAAAGPAAPTDTSANTQPAAGELNAQAAGADADTGLPVEAIASRASAADADAADNDVLTTATRTKPDTVTNVGATIPPSAANTASPGASGTSAAPEPTAQASAVQIAPAPAENAVLSPDERRQLALSRQAQPREAPPPTMTDRPVPAGSQARAAAAGGAIAAQEKDVNGSLPEVAVAGSRARRNETYDSPNAIVATTEELQESVVTTSRREKREIFSRKVSAPAIPPPAAAASEGRDKFQHFETNPVKRVADDPVSTFSVDVDTAAYSFVRRKLNEGVLPQMDAVRVEEMINYFDYAWPTSDSRDEPFKPTVTVSDSPWGKGKKLIHIGIKGYALPASQQPDVNLVLLLDVSGSMASPDKLPLAQRSMALLLDSLRPTDTVALVVYAGAAGQVLPPTPVSEKETILRALSSLEPGGSTAGAEGIQLAYALAEKSFRKGGVNRILLATDGDFNVGITDPNELKSFVAREREKGVYLSVLGFGEGNYRDEMAQTLAQNGNGVAAYIDTLSEAKKVLVQEATSSLFPIAKDVKLQVEFNPATVAEYRLVGYETRSLNREDFNNDKVDAGDVGSGHTVTAIYEITPVDSDARLIDERRYASREEKAAARGKAQEYGFLKIRYKLPNGFRSRLLEQPILMDAGVPAALRDDVSFSTAVAGFGQLLRGSQYVGSLSFEDVIRQAQAGIGADPYGYRAEFVRLVSKAQHARGQ